GINMGTDDEKWEPNLLQPSHDNKLKRYEEEGSSSDDETPDNPHARPVGAPTLEPPEARSVYHTPDSSPQPKLKPPKNEPSTIQNQRLKHPTDDTLEITAENLQVPGAVGAPIEPPPERPKRIQKTVEKNGDYCRAVDLEEWRKEDRREAKRAKLSSDTEDPSQNATHHTLLDI
ncbi:hypothetical protein C0993_010366, partial [Termitomyces sp. T159_Od127]